LLNNPTLSQAAGYIDYTKVSMLRLKSIAINVL
jgi:hypothetical protein